MARVGYLGGFSLGKKEIGQEIHFFFTQQVLNSFFSSIKGFQSHFLEEFINGNFSWEAENLWQGNSLFSLGSWTPPPHHPGRVIKPMDLGLDYGNTYPMEKSEFKPP